MSQLTRGVFVCALVAAGLLPAGDGVAMPQTAQRYRLVVQSVPHAPTADGRSHVTGTADLTVTGLHFDLALNLAGVSPDLPHSVLIDGTFGAHNACPTPATDTDGDGLIEFAESTVATGAVQKAVTTGGSKDPQHAFALDRMPVADAGGALGYTRSFSATGDIADHVAHMVVVVYGLDLNHSGAYEGAEATIPIACAAIDVNGYWMSARSGEVLAFGDARVFGSARDSGATDPVVGLEPTPSGAGYWQVTDTGRVYNFGDAAGYGGAIDIRLNHPIVGLAATPSGRGYWLVASDGGIFAYGDAQFYGSTGAIRLNQPIVGMSPTPSGLGYWLVASDGGIFAFGDAQFYGSTGSIRLNQPVLDMASANGGTGYWLVARDGGIFAFGDAQFYGSTGAIRLNQPVVGMVASSSSRGYFLGAADGGIFTFGDAPFVGSAGGIPGTPTVSGVAAV